MKIFKMLFLTIVLTVSCLMMSCSSEEKGICQNPKGVSSYMERTTDVTIFWNPWRNADNYTIEYGLFGFSLGTGTRIVVQGRDKKITGLQPDTQYHFFIRSNCSVGDEVEFNGPNLLQTAPICPNPEDLRVIDITQTTIEIRWTPTTNRFVVEYGLSGFELGTGDDVTILDGFFAAYNLEPNTSYDFYVKARCSDYNSSDNETLLGLTTLP